MKFKVGDKVTGRIKVYDPLTEAYPEENNETYIGTVCRDYNDGSYSVNNLVDDNRYEILVELYNGETMELLKD